MMTEPARFIRSTLFSMLVMAGLAVFTGAAALTASPANTDEASEKTNHPPPSAGQWKPSAPVDPSTAGSGELLWKSRQGLIRLPVVNTDAELTVTGILLHAKVTQTFMNPTDDVIETIYVFPLPDGAAVNHMEMRIDDRRIVSVIKEREEARKTYDQARQEGRKAALLDQERPNLFTCSAANINPGESISVVLEYLETLRFESGAFGLRLPLTLTPRYIPDSACEEAQSPFEAAPAVPDAERITPPFIAATPSALPKASIHVRIDAGIALTGCGKSRVTKKEVGLQRTLRG